MARMRGVKAEGGWSVVCTEQCDHHWTSDSTREIRLWDDRTCPIWSARRTRSTSTGRWPVSNSSIWASYGRNLYSREPTMSPSGQAPASIFPGYARAMDKQDIRDYRTWHRNAALRAKRAGFDLIMVYAGHNLSLAMHFLSRRHNQRTDEYGGVLENRCGCCVN